MSQSGNRSGSDGQYVLEDGSAELIDKKIKRKASMLSLMAKKEEMARGIIRGVLEKVDTIHMVKLIILDEVDSRACHEAKKVTRNIGPIFLLLT